MCERRSRLPLDVSAAADTTGLNATTTTTTATTTTTTHDTPMAVLLPLTNARELFTALVCFTQLRSRITPAPACGIVLTHLSTRVGDNQRRHCSADCGALPLAPAPHIMLALESNSHFGVQKPIAADSSLAPARSQRYLAIVTGR